MYYVYRIFSKPGVDSSKLFEPWVYETMDLYIIFDRLAHFEQLKEFYANFVWITINCG